MELTGATYGGREQNGIKLAVDEITKLVASTFLELVIKDNKSENAEASTFNKLGYSE